MKNIILGVSGGIAAYKACDLTSILVKRGYNVHVVMTNNATEFVKPLVFETLTNNPVVLEQFKRTNQVNVEHVSLSKIADLFVVAPATANVIAKFAYGIADDALSTQFISADCQKLLCPSMNTKMYLNKIVQQNMEKLKNNDVLIMEAVSGRLACQDEGIGKLPNPENIADYIDLLIKKEKDLTGLNVLVTAGATTEKIDAVRYITNPSSGLMGHSIAKEFALRGANVTFISPKLNIKVNNYYNHILIESAKDMEIAVNKVKENQDIIVMSAAIADYRPKVVFQEKLKKSRDEINIELEKTTDILKELGKSKKTNQKLIGFSMETSDLIPNSRKKLIEKNLDMIIANNLNTEGAGFKTNTNVVTIIKNDDEINLDLMTKEELATIIVNEIIKL